MFVVLDRAKESRNSLSFEFVAMILMDLSISLFILSIVGDYVCMWVEAFYFVNAEQAIQLAIDKPNLRAVVFKVCITKNTWRLSVFPVLTDA